MGGQIGRSDFRDCRPLFSLKGYSRQKEKP
jgi:hypothetical protein